MVTQKLSISLTPELAETVRDLAERREEDVSRLIEIALRESPLVTQAIARRRRAASPPRTRRGRDPEELRLLGEMARRSWASRLASGEVSVRGWE